MLPGRVIDLTHRLLAGEEEYGLEIETHRVQDLYPQYRSVPEDHYVMTRIRLSPHIGTHIEAPSHLIRGGSDVSGLALDKLVGEALIMDFTHKLDDEAITLAEIQAYAGRLRAGDIVLLRTGRSAFYRTQRAHARPYVNHEAIEWLASQDIACLGTDASGIEQHGAERQINHLSLFRRGIPLVEFLNNLDQIRTDRVMVCILPWNMVGAEASPVRVIAIEQP
jgi:arylformamidase